MASLSPYGAYHLGAKLITIRAEVWLVCISVSLCPPNATLLIVAIARFFAVWYCFVRPPSHDAHAFGLAINPLIHQTLFKFRQHRVARRTHISSI